MCRPVFDETVGFPAVAGRRLRRLMSRRRRATLTEFENEHQKLLISLIFLCYITLDGQVAE